MNVAREAWRAARTGLRRAMFWRSSVMRCAGSTGSAVGVSSLPGIVIGVSSLRGLLGARHTPAQLLMLVGPL
jgi:hypothetical protein